MLAAGFISATPAHAAFKCVDDKGITYYGDTMPAACAKKAVTEYSRAGGVVRKIDAPLTPEQIKVRDEEREKQRVIELKVDEQRTRDLALMATFGKESDFDTAKARDVKSFDERKVALAARMETLAKQLAKFNEDAEFYQAGASKSAKAREVPARLTADIARVKAEQTTVTALIKRTEAEKLENAARYEMDRERWKRLKGGMKAGTLDSATPPPAAPTSALPPSKKTNVAKK